MGFTALIDVAIGLTLLYLGAALFVTVANEYIAQVFNMRANHLKESLATLFTTGKGDQLVDTIKNSPVFKPLLDGDGKPRSYIDPTVLAQTIVGGLQPVAAGAMTVTQLAGAINALPDSQLKNVLNTLSRTSGDKIERFTDDVAQWIDRSLKVLGDGYKRNIQTLSFCLGLLLAVAFNIDTLHVTARLYHDKELRERVALSAQQIAAATSSKVFTDCLAKGPDERRKAPECKELVQLPEDIAQRTGALGELPIGWNGWAQVRQELTQSGVTYQIQRVLGWLLTALAISIGAPFWFDLLNRLVNVRHGIRRPEPEKAAG